MKPKDRKNISESTNSTPYNGEIKPKIAALGIELSNRNAESLLKESELLFDNKFFARATALAILAIEEASKESILREIVTASSTKALRAAWKSFRKHTRKNLLWPLLSIATQGWKSIEDFAILFDPNSNHGKYLESVKQACLYVDIVSETKWKTPETITPEMARAIRSFARILVTERNVSEAEIELWQKHFKNREHSSLQDMKKPALAFYEEAMLKGILPQDFDFELLKRLVGIDENTQR